MKWNTSILSLGILIAMLSCAKENIHFDKIQYRNNLLEKKRIAYESYDQAHIFVKKYLDGEIGSKDALDEILNLHVLKDANRSDLRRCFDEIENLDLENPWISPVDKILLNEIHHVFDEFVRDRKSYNEYLDDLIDVWYKYREQGATSAYNQLVEVYATIFPYWIENETKWKSLKSEYARGDCPIAQAAIDAAIVGCTVGSIAGAAGTPAGSAAACVVGGVMAGTGATLWTAIKCAAAKIAAEW